MKARIAALAVAILLAGCAERRAQDAVREMLTDPQSAQFGDITLSDDGKVACGRVNAKNRMGGYVGETSFMAIEDQAWVSGGSGEFPLAVSSCCYAMISKHDGLKMDEAEAERFRDCRFLTPAVPGYP